MKRWVWAIAVGVPVALAVGAQVPVAPSAVPQARAAAEPLSALVARRVARNPPLGALPPDPTNRLAGSTAAAELGHRIFFDTRFSASGAVSCATCHDPGHGFADERPIARGEGAGTRHAMSVLNSAYNRWFTWDGRADTAWSQALQPFETPHEHGVSRARVVELVAGDANLRALYTAAVGAPPGGGAQVDDTFANIGKSLAAYERMLVTGPSAYDRWWVRHAAGDPAANEELTPEARRGLVLFFDRARCFECHHGANFTDGEFHMIGAPLPGGAAPTDPGRYAVVDRVRADPFNAAGPHSDDREGTQARISAALVRSPDLWGQVKTPSLRTATRTGPYMHQGQFATLASVVRFYSTLEGATALDHHQERVLNPLDLTPQEEADLVAFLHALEGPMPGLPWGAAPSTEPEQVPANTPVAPPPSTADTVRARTIAPVAGVHSAQPALPCTVGDAP